MIRIASYNVENLFACPKAFNPANWDEGEPIIDAYQLVNSLFNNLHVYLQIKWNKTK